MGMNYIWGMMLLLGIVYGIVAGNVEAVSDAVLASAKEAVTLCVTMLGVMGLWMGLMQIAQDAGLIRMICGKIQPLIRFLFPQIPPDHPANEHIAMNCAANFLGLGAAATPAGLKAMESLAELEEERRSGKIENPTKPGAKYRDRSVESSAGVAIKNRRKKPCAVSGMPPGVASDEMCTFLILNISSLQLIPVNVIAYRSQYGSVNPTAIVGPGIVATAVSTIVAVIFCKVMDWKQRA